MDQVFIYIVAAVTIGVIIYKLFFSRRAVIHGIIKKNKAKKIANVQNNEVVRISGKIIYAGRTMLAPLSQRTCVYYHVSVKDSSHRRDFLKNHIDIVEERILDVVIQDGDHYAVIDTKLVASSVATDHHMNSGFWNISTPELKAFLVKHGERPTNIVGWSFDLTGEEGVLEEGERLEVVGKAVWREASDFKLNIHAKKVLHITALNEHGVYLADDMIQN